jgi:hypothetical protein
MKNLILYIITSSAILFMVPNTYAFFMFVNDTTLNAATDAMQTYTITKDQIQNVREIQKLTNMANEITKLQTQINQGVDMINIGTDTYKKAKTLVDWHGDWKAVDPLDLASNLSRETDQKLNTTASILNRLADAPETAVNNTKILRDYIGEIDTKNWTLSKVDSKEKLKGDMVAFSEYATYEDFNKKIHGYKDQYGIIHDGELDSLGHDLKIAKDRLAIATTDVDFKAYTSKVAAINKKMDDLLDKEKDLRDRYKVAAMYAEKADKFRQNVTTYRIAKEDKADKDDKTVRIASQKSLNDYFSKQESEVVF